MNRKLLLALLVCLSLMCCRKINPERLSGTVLDDSTHSSIPAAQIGLYDYHDQSTANLILLKEMTSGSDGKFIIEYNLRRNKPYALIVSKAGYSSYFYSFKKGDQITNLVVYLKK